MRMTTAVGALAALGAAATASAQSIQLVNVAPHVSHVVAIAHAGDGSNRLFFGQQFGRVLVHQGGATLATPFLDISGLVRTTGPEEGLLGLAFHPQYESNGYFFVYYTNLAGDNVVARYHVSAAANVADPTSAQVVLTLPHPETDRHNGGQLQFGPDGFLYIGTGDGAPPGDVLENAQNLASLLGKILRIRVDALPYSIPPGNPFVGAPGARPEIWAYGLRNPWRFSFDRATGDLYIGDVGEQLIEEVDFQPAGSPGGINYGWDDMEGSRCFEPPVGCLTAGRTLPIIEFPHFSTFGFNCSVLGGYRYRGTAMPGLVGNYVFADFCNPRILAAHEFPDGWGMFQASLADVFNYSTLGEDESGELYVAQLIYEIKGPVIDGNVYRLAPGPPPSLRGGSVSAQETAGSVAAPVDMDYSYLPVTVDWTTVSGTATAAKDFVSSSGSLTFPPWTSLRSADVGLLDDATDENDETFTVRLSNAHGAVIAQDSSQLTIVDDDPAPFMVGFGCGTVEGNAGTTPCSARVRLLAPSERTVSVGFATTGSGSATPGVDYQRVSGSVTIAPGASEGFAIIPVIGDTVVETSEFFGIALGPAANAQLLTTSVVGNITEDDVAVAAGRELAHGSTVTGDLAAGADDLYRLQVGPFEAYEVTLDQRSGDAQGARLELLGSPILSGQPTGTGGALAVRFVNTIEAVHTSLFVRVTHPSCGSCDAQDTYRLSVRETTLRAPRFNNRNGQASVLVLANTQAAALTALAHFWSETGSYLGAILLPLPPRGTAALNTANEPLLQGQSGSLTITHGGAYGAVVGKISSLDPASGSAFDTPVESRQR